MQRRTILLISADDCGWTDLRAVLAEMVDMHLVGEVRSAHQVQWLVTSAIPAPDVVIAAACVEDTSAVPLLTAIRREYWPATRLLVFAPHFDPDELLAFAGLGVRGFLLWGDLSPAAIRHSLELVLTRDVVISSGVVATAFGDALSHCHRAGNTPASPVAMGMLPCQTDDTCRGVLTPREHEVLTLIADDQSNAEIACALNIAVRTVDFHVRNLLAKLEARSRTGAVSQARRRRLLSA